MIPHKHAEVIKKWAEGHVIQGRRDDGEGWVIISDPSWDEYYQYRVNPTTARYRVVLLQNQGRIYTLTMDAEEEVENLRRHAAFVRFLTDWIEYEV